MYFYNYQFLCLLITDFFCLENLLISYFCNLSSLQNLENKSLMKIIDLQYATSLQTVLIKLQNSRILFKYLLKYLLLHFK